MVTEKFSGTMESAYGATLDSAIKFEGEFTAFESYDELKTANEQPSNDELVVIVNNKRKANARQKSMTAALEAAGIAKPTLADPAEQVRQLVKVLLASGKYNDTQANAIAKQTLGL